METLAEVTALARTHKIPTHMDGARLMNGAVALGVDIGEIASHVDSVWLDFSKGLGAPIGCGIVSFAPGCAKSRGFAKPGSGQTWEVFGNATFSQGCAGGLCGLYRPRMAVRLAKNSNSNSNSKAQTPTTVAYNCPFICGQAVNCVQHNHLS